MRRPWWREPTRQQWSCFLAAWAGWVVDAFDFTVYLLVAAHIADEFGATLTAVNGVVTATLLCRLMGGIVAGTMALKLVVLHVLGRMFGLDGPARWLLALGLAQIGEFAFVLLTFGVQHRVFTADVADPLVAGM